MERKPLLAAVPLRFGSLPHGKVQHTPGSMMTNADFLSRYPMGSLLNQSLTEVSECDRAPPLGQSTPGRKSPELALEYPRGKNEVSECDRAPPLGHSTPGRKSPVLALEYPRGKNEGLTSVCTQKSRDAVEEKVKTEKHGDKDGRKQWEEGSEEQEEDENTERSRVLREM
ncbi:hypothetical protein NDU88_004421 [Pleurodeles waltl]|uniref:Uncharacterized protein n=1 Tax=Pleurodeles waltl TaxID=8319 RepID=A0AAV7VG63_PLEWA|nr:hypothetical protein NDU88_004421 [Pleurodeles waltl]